MKNTKYSVIDLLETLGYASILGVGLWFFYRLLYLFTKQSALTSIIITKRFCIAELVILIAFGLIFYLLKKGEDTSILDFLLYLKCRPLMHINLRYKHQRNILISITGMLMLTLFIAKEINPILVALLLYNLAQFYFTYIVIKS